MLNKLWITGCIVISLCACGTIFAQEERQDDTGPAIIWKAEASNKALEEAKLPTVWPDEFMTQKLSEYKLNPGEKKSFLLTVDDSDSYTLRGLAYRGYRSGTFSSAGNIEPDSVKITVPDGIKAELKNVNVGKSEVQAKWQATLEITAGKKIGEFPIVITFIDPGQSGADKKEILPNPTDVDRKQLNISGTLIDKKISSTFTVIVTDEKLNRPIPTIIWSPEPSEKRSLSINPKFRNEQNHEIFILYLSKKSNRKEVPIVIYFQDFDSLEVKDVPGLKDQKKDRYGDVDSKWVTIKVRGGELKYKLTVLEARKEMGFYEAELLIAIPEKAGEYFVDVTLTDKGNVDKDGKEILPVPDSVRDRVKKILGTRIDKPITRTLKVEVR